MRYKGSASGSDHELGSDRICPTLDIARQIFGRWGISDQGVTCSLMRTGHLCSSLGVFRFLLIQPSTHKALNRDMRTKSVISSGILLYNSRHCQKEAHALLANPCYCMFLPFLFCWSEYRACARYARVRATPRPKSKQPFDNKLRRATTLSI